MVARPAPHGNLHFLEVPSNTMKPLDSKEFIMKKALSLAPLFLLCLALALAAGCSPASRGKAAGNAQAETAAARTTADPNSPNQHAQ